MTALTKLILSATVFVFFVPSVHAETLRGADAVKAISSGEVLYISGENGNFYILVEHRGGVYICSTRFDGVGARRYCVPVS